MTDKQIIQALRENRFAFGMWPDPECYGEELGKAMQAKANEIGRSNFIVYGSSAVSWIKGDDKSFFDNRTYRLNPDYTAPDEKPYVEYKVTTKLIDEDFRIPGYVFEDGTFHGLREIPDGFVLAGFKFGDDGIHASEILYQLSSGDTQSVYYPVMGDFEVLTPTHVCFKREE